MSSQQSQVELKKTLDAFECPISHDTMLDPVIDKEGNSYERAAIMEWLRNHNTSPVTRNPLSQDDLTENRALKNAIHEYYEQTGQKIPETPPVSAAAAINTDDVYTLLAHYGVGFMIDEETEGGGLYGTHGMSRTFEDGRRGYQYDLEQAELELQYYYYVYPIRAPDERGDAEDLESYDGQTLVELFVEVGGEEFLRELVDNPDWPEFYNPGALAQVVEDAAPAQAAAPQAAAAEEAAAAAAAEQEGAAAAAEQDYPAPTANFIPWVPDDTTRCMLCLRPGTFGWVPGEEDILCQRCSTLYMFDDSRNEGEGYYRLAQAGQE